MRVRTLATLRCVDCELLFQRRADSITRSADGKVRCKSCSRREQIRGRNPSRKRGSIVACGICGEPFYRPPSAQTRKYCSIPCRTEAARRADRHQVPLVDNSGERNGRYKHGGRVGKHTPKAAVRAAVIDRDGDWCLLCGRPPKGLHLHRVRYGSEGGAYENINCVQLCPQHHATVHTSKRRWQPALLAYLESGSVSDLTTLRRLLEEAA